MVVELVELSRALAIKFKVLLLMICPDFLIRVFTFGICRHFSNTLIINIIV